MEDAPLLLQDPQWQPFFSRTLYLNLEKLISLDRWKLREVQVALLA